MIFLQRESHYKKKRTKRQTPETLLPFKMYDLTTFTVGNFSCQLKTLASMLFNKRRMMLKREIIQLLKIEIDYYSQAS